MLVNAMYRFLFYEFLVQSYIRCILHGCSFYISRASQIREMYIGYACLCVCLSLAAFQHYCMDPDVT